jgi:chromosome segregation ATPase
MEKEFIKSNKVLLIIAFIAVLLSIGSIITLVIQGIENNKLNNRVTELENKIEESNNSDNVFWKELKRVEDKIVNPAEMVNEKVQNKINEIEKKIENLRTMYDEFTVKNISIENDVQTVQDDVQTVQDDVQSVQEQVDELDPNVDTSKN